MASGTAGTGGTQSGSPASTGSAALKGGGTFNGGNANLTETHTEYRSDAQFVSDSEKSK